MLGNIHEESQLTAKSGGRRSASPADGRGHVISHTPSNGLEEETSSDDDTGGQVRERGRERREGVTSGSTGIPVLRNASLTVCRLL